MGWEIGGREEKRRTGSLPVIEWGAEAYVVEGEGAERQPSDEKRPPFFLHQILEVHRSHRILPYTIHPIPCASSSIPSHATLARTSEAPSIAHLLFLCGCVRSWLVDVPRLPSTRVIWESDLQAGAYTGYQLIWVLLLATTLGLFMQILAVRLGVVTGRHLAQMCRQEYGTKQRYMVWAVIECAVIGSDIQEILGSALAFQILFGLPLWAGVIITAADTFTFLFLHVSTSTHTSRAHHCCGETLQCCTACLDQSACYAEECGDVLCCGGVCGCSRSASASWKRSLLPSSPSWSSASSSVTRHTPYTTRADDRR